MDYFKIIPTELHEIILSYITANDILNIYELLLYPLNWSQVYIYHFGEYKKMNFEDYIKYLKGEILLKWMKSLVTITVSFDSEVPLEYNVNTFSIDSIFKLSSLFLIEKNIETIPYEIHILSNLKRLYLLDNKIGPNIPTGIFKLYNLKILVLSRNLIKNIDKNIKNLYNLEELYIDNNKLKNIDGIYNLKNLKILWLSHNLIENMNDKVKNLNNLEEFYINNNKLKNIDGIYNLINLQILKFSHNLIENIDDKVKKLLNLEELYINNNLLKEITPKICELKKLYSLDISYNNIINIPQCIYDIKYIKF